MPTVFYVLGFRFFFYSNENNEPIHIHVEKNNGFGKIWLEPEIEIAYMHNFSNKDINKILKIIHDRIIEIKSKWNEHFK